MADKNQKEQNIDRGTEMGRGKDASRQGQKGQDMGMSQQNTQTAGSRGSSSGGGAGQSTSGIKQGGGRDKGND